MGGLIHGAVLFIPQRFLTQQFAELLYFLELNTRKMV